MSIRQRSLTAFALLMCFSLRAHAIDNSTRAAARTLVNDGVALFNAGKYVEAQPKFMAALAVVEVPTVALWAARTHEKMGHWVHAAELYQRVQLMRENELWIGDAQQEAQQQAQAALQSLSPRIPTVRLELHGALTSELEVTIDSAKIPSALLSAERPLDPGEHVVSTTRAGRASVSAKFVLSEGERKVVVLDLPTTDEDASPSVPPTAPPPLPAMAPSAAQHSAALATSSNPSSERNSGSHWPRTVGWVGVGVGATGLTVGAIATVFIAGKQKSLVRDGCTPRTCPNEDFTSRVDSYNRMRNVATAAYVVGAVGATAGLTLLLTHPSPSTTGSVGLVISPNDVSLTGAF